MEPEAEKNEITDENAERGGNYFLKITVTEAIFVLIILIIVLTCKFVWNKGFSRFSEWYSVNMTSDTDPDEVLGAFADGGADEV